MRFSLRQIEVFLATARLETLSQAAEHLAMSQSAASGALQDLESRYATQLFDRIGKRLKINANGMELLPHAEALLSQAQELEHVIQSHEPGGILRIGATLTIGNYIAIEIISTFKQALPRIDASLHVANTQAIARQVLKFELDVGLIEGEFAHDDLTIMPWRNDELEIFCAPSHPLAAVKSLDTEHLIEANWILREQGSGTRQTFDRAMQGMHNTLKIFLELEHTEAIKRAVESGVGIGCLSKLALRDAYAAGRLVPLAAPQLNMQRTLYLIMHRQKHRSAALKEWLRYCDKWPE
jgi:DNA-binding transcriptional LysR family regulator